LMSSGRLPSTPTEPLIGWPPGLHA
jgi:hypothetical protein